MHHLVQRPTRKYEMKITIYFYSHFYNNNDDFYFHLLLLTRAFFQKREKERVKKNEKILLICIAINLSFRNKVADTLLNITFSSLYVHIFRFSRLFHCNNNQNRLLFCTNIDILHHRVNDNKF